MSEGVKFGLTLTICKRRSGLRSFTHLIQIQPMSRGGLLNPDSTHLRMWAT